MRNKLNTLVVVLIVGGFGVHPADAQYYPPMGIGEPRPSPYYDASPFDETPYRDNRYVGGTEEYQEELRRERYRTAITRERAERAYLDYRMRSYEHQRQQQEVYLSLAEQRQQYEQRTNGILTANQAANVIGNVVRQIQVLGGRGW